MQVATSGVKRCWDWVKDHTRHDETSRKAPKQAPGTSPSLAAPNASTVPRIVSDQPVVDNAQARTSTGGSSASFDEVRLDHQTASQKPSSQPHAVGGSDQPEQLSGRSSTVDIGHLGAQLPSILLTKELSNILQEAVVADRNLREATARRDTRLKIEESFMTWSQRKQSEFLLLLEAHEGIEDSDRIRDHLQRKVRGRDMKHEEMRIDVAACREQVSSLEQQASIANKAAVLAIQDVLVRSKSMSASQQGKTDEDREFERKYAIPQAGDDIDAIVFLSQDRPGSDHEPAARSVSPGAEIILDPGVVRKAQAMQGYYIATDNVRRAQMHFDARYEDDAHQHIAEPDDAGSTGSPHATATQRDLHVLQRHRELTRDLIEAEEAFSEARREAKAVGVETRSQAHSDDGWLSEAAGENVDYRAWCDAVAIQAWVDQLPSKFPSKRGILEQCVQKAKADAKALEKHEHEERWILGNV